MKKVQTYTPPEGELLSVFTNWAGDGSTNNLPVSGKAIRELLLDRLQKPFFLKHDDINKLYRVFRSEADYEKWTERGLHPGDPEYENLELTNFIAPSPYSIELTKFNDPTDIFDVSERILRDGAQTDDTKIRFSWNIKQDDEDYTDSLVINCSITNSAYGRKQLDPMVKSASEKNVEFDLFDYLNPGTNVVDLSFLGEHCKATRNTQVTIIIVTMSLRTWFPYQNVFRNGESYNFNVLLQCSTDTTKNVYYYIDAEETPSGQEPTAIALPLYSANTPMSFSATEKNTTKKAEISFSGLSHGKHTLQILAETTIGTSTFCSNLLFYEFVIDLPVDGQYPQQDFIVTKTSFDDVYVAGATKNYQLYAIQNKENLLDWAFVTLKTREKRKDITWYVRTIDVATEPAYLEFLLASLVDIVSETERTLQYQPEVYTVEDDQTHTVTTYCQLVAGMTPQGGDAFSPISIYNIYIYRSDYSVSETGGYELKLKAYGKLGADPTWTYYKPGRVDQHGQPVPYTTTFTGFTWDEKRGWSNNALQIDENSYAVVNFAPFADNTLQTEGYETRNSILLFGRTVEIEFEISNVGDFSEDLITIGDWESENGSIGIRIRPNEASIMGKQFKLVNGVPTQTISSLVTTNYKENERIKLAFVILPSVNETSLVDSHLLWIINNGILERCEDNQDRIFDPNEGTIKLGKLDSNSHVAVYSIRCYDFALTPEQEFGNFAIDSKQTNQILYKNDIFANGQITFEKIRNKIDTILITGPLHQIINATGSGDARKNVNIAATILRFCPSDESYNFTIKNGRIRAHGLSTLNYPIPSFKIWSNSEFLSYNNVQHGPGTEYSDLDRVVMYRGASYDDPTSVMTLDNRLYKGRYQFKEGAIPANKWVLQANYADSSGVHNGGIQRLIQDTWFKAQINTVTRNGQGQIVSAGKQYALRTDPQLFVTNTGKYANNGWSANKGDNLPFPYTLRSSADSIPCVLFYRRTELDAPIFVGLFVFMDDKKSDFIYGERSIYKCNAIDENKKQVADPFCMYEVNKDADKKDGNGERVNLIWDNSNVLRLEQTTINNEFSSFMGTTKYWTTEDGEPIIDTGTGQQKVTQFSGTTGYQSPDTETYYWEEDFELVYPEKEDITTNKVYDHNKFTQTVLPFVDFFLWLVDSRSDYVAKLDNIQDSTFNVEVGDMYVEPITKRIIKVQSDDPIIGTTITAKKVTASQLPTLFSAFRTGAWNHLDLYKIAAYYIFFLRFGLVDSVERNAQLKTYDGQHWHFEPWDMDIALGNNNKGQITFSPPIDRNTKWGRVFAFSGRGARENDGSFLTSNWLYDALEAWESTVTTLTQNGETVQVIVPGFLGDNSIVKNTAQALYDAGLKYPFIIEELDGNYSEKWSERIYNFSGHYKYIENGNSGYYNWLQGARTTHRHWWLKNSLDYWDAEWGVGQFTEKRVYMQVDANPGNKIKFKPVTETYFALSYNNTLGEKQRFKRTDNGELMLWQSTQNKTPLYIYGSKYIEELDLSNIAVGLQTLVINGCYDDDLKQSFLKKLNVGVPISSMENGVFNTKPFGLNANETASADGTALEIDETDSQKNAKVMSTVLGGVEEFNISGYTDSGTTGKINNCLENMQRLKIFKAVGSNYTTFNGIAAPTQYDTLQLPSSINKLILDNASWKLPRNLDTSVEPEINNPDTWEGLTIWDVVTDVEPGAQGSGQMGEYHFEQVGDSYYAGTGTFENGELSLVSPVLNDILLLNNTGQYSCSFDLVMTVINACKNQAKEILNSENEDSTWRTTYRKMLNGISLQIDKINWVEVRMQLTYDDLLDLASFNRGVTSKLKGYVVMKAEDGITPVQLNERFVELKSRFGNDCFSWYGTGLRIDYTTNTVVATIGKPTNAGSSLISNSEFYYDTQNGGCYHIAGGYDANGVAYQYPLDATIFTLSKDGYDTTWTLEYKAANDTFQPVSSSYFGVMLSQNGARSEAYLNIPEMGVSVTSPILFKLTCSATLNNTTNTATIYVEVLPRNYPTSITFSCENDPDGNNPISISGQNGFLLSEYGKPYRITPTIVYNMTQTVDATVASITWLFKIPEEQNASDTLYTAQEVQSGSKYQITLNEQLGPSSYKYTGKLLYTVKFKSGYVTTSEKQIRIEYDPVVVNTSNQELYNALNAAFNLTGHTQYGTGEFRKSELELLTSSVTCSAQLGHYYTQIGTTVYWIFDYLPNLTSFVVNSSTATDESIYENNALDLAKMPNLTTFKVNGTGNVYASSLCSIQTLELGNVSSFDDNNMSNLLSVKIKGSVTGENIRISLAKSNQYQIINNLKNILDRVPSGVVSETHTDCDVKYLKVNNLGAGNNNAYYSISDNEYSSFSKFITIIKASLGENSTVSVNLQGKIHVNVITSSDKADYELIYPQAGPPNTAQTVMMELSYGHVAIDFKDPAVESYYTSRLGTNYVTKDQLETMSFVSIVTSSASSLFEHFPEARYLILGDVNDKDYGVVYLNRIRSIIIPKPVVDEQVETGNGDRLLKDLSFVTADYVDYGNCTKFMKDSHNFDNCDGIVVFWKYVELEKSGNVPGSDAYILLPNYLARNLGSLLGHPNIFIFNPGKHNQESLWNIFYEAYKTNESLADAKAAFVTQANTANSGIQTLSAYLA